MFACLYVIGLCEAAGVSSRMVENCPNCGEYEGRQFTEIITEVVEVKTERRLKCCNAINKWRENWQHRDGVG